VELYTREKVGANVTKIADVSGVYAYLVEGSQEAALIDTCSGLGDLGAYVRGLTALPVTAICTHGHCDHAGGAACFDTVYLNEQDFELAKRHTTLEMRRGSIDETLQRFAATMPGSPLPTISDIDYVPQRNGRYLNLVDGQVFDLGGITLEAIALPGHTQGMTCVLIRELRTVLLGDGCNPFTFLFLPECSSVEQYRLSLLSFLRHEDRYDSVWFSHGIYKGPKAIVHECVEVCDDIMQGKADNLYIKPFSFLERGGMIAKAMAPGFRRADGKMGNIVYHPGNVFIGQEP
jgi:hydroxyacylglutathione hydrolase